MKTENTSVQACCIDNNDVSHHEIASACNILLHNAFSQCKSPYYVFQANANTKKFLEEHSDCSSTEELKIIADLEQNEDAINALEMKLAAEKYAARLLQFVNKTIRFQNTQNVGM